METQVLLDKLSEFLMVEQGGLQLYAVCAARSTSPDLQARYEQFGRQTSHHREVLVRLIERLGGDPNYVSPTARVARFKAAKLLESSSCVDGLSLLEVEMNDLENVLLAETKDHADWQLLSLLVQQLEDGHVKEAIAEAVEEVEPEEDDHLAWARDTLSANCLSVLREGPAPLPQRWMEFITSPMQPIDEIHPAPLGDEDGLMDLARRPQWQESEIARSMQIV